MPLLEAPKRSLAMQCMKNERRCTVKENETFPSFAVAHFDASVAPEPQLRHVQQLNAPRMSFYLDTAKANASLSVRSTIAIQGSMRES